MPQYERWVDNEDPCRNNFIIKSMCFTKKEYVK